MVPQQHPEGALEQGLDGCQERYSQAHLDQVGSPNPEVRSMGGNIRLNPI